MLRSAIYLKAAGEGGGKITITNQTLDNFILTSFFFLLLSERQSLPFLCFCSDYSALHAQIPTPGPRHPQGVWRGAISGESHPRWGGNAHLLLPRDRFHHRHGISEPAGTDHVHTSLRSLTGGTHKLETRSER